MHPVVQPPTAAAGGLGRAGRGRRQHPVPAGATWRAAGWWPWLAQLLWALLLPLWPALPAQAQPQPPAASAAHTTPPVLRFTHAERAFGEGPQPPAAGWQPVQVPEVFTTSAHTGARIGWYRFGFHLAQVPEQPLVLLAQRVVLTAEFRINGSVLNPGVHFQQLGGPAGTMMLNQPHWLVVPAGLLRAGPNELLVRLSGDQVTPAWLSGLSLGPAPALRGEFLLRDIPQRLVPQALLVLLLAALLFGLRLWWPQRLPLQGLMLLTTLLWLCGLGLYLAADLPVPWRVGVVLTAVQWIGFHWCLLLLLWRLGGQGWAWFPRAVHWGSALPLLGAAVVLAVEPPHAMLGLLMLPTLVLRSLTTFMLLRWAWRTRTATALLLASSELLWFAGPLQLLLVVLDLIPPDPFMLSPADALPLFLVLLWLGARQLAGQRDEALQQRHAAVLAERQRMMLDMHDGIGSQLVTALRLARREEVPRAELAEVVQEALNDLRLIVDAQDGAAQELQSLLWQWRERQERRLAALGPQLHWQLSALPAPRPLSPPQALQVLRILQEALNNAVQHAGARRLHISLAPLPDGCELRVADDGCGLPAPGITPGRGLAGMQQRATRLGAQLQVRNAEGGGTVVSLRLPNALPA